MPNKRMFTGVELGNLGLNLLVSNVDIRSAISGEGLNQLHQPQCSAALILSTSKEWKAK